MLAMGITKNATLLMFLQRHAALIPLIPVNLATPTCPLIVLQWPSCDSLREQISRLLSLFIAEALLDVIELALLLSLGLALRRL